MLIFEERGKPEYPKKKPLEARTRTNYYPGSIRGLCAICETHWWEASALTTAPRVIHFILIQDTNITFGASLFSSFTPPLSQ